MERKYYFEFEEPYLKDKNIICAFNINYIEKKRCYFFIAEENDKIVVYYLQIKSSDMIKFIQEYSRNVSLDKNICIDDTFKIPDFIEKYNNKYLQCKMLNNPSCIKTLINKMAEDDIYKAKNNQLGLDGYSVKLKLDNKEKYFYSWVYADDKKYFYVIDFINSILDELEINDEYRFRKNEE